MEYLKEIICEFNIFSVFLRIVLAAIIGGAIGSERGRHGRAAGLRTHILVCVGGCMTSMTSIYVSAVQGFDGDVFRISAQVISGIGFLGAGMIILKNNSVITGLTTAAGVWATGAIGVAFGYGFYSGALVATVVCIFSVTVLSRLEKNRKNTVYTYIELTDIAATEEVIEKLKNFGGAISSYDIIPPKSGKQGNIGILCLISGIECYDELKAAVYSSEKLALMVRDINL